MLSIVTSSRHFPIIWLNECKNNNIDLRLEFCLYSWKILRSSAFFSSEKLKKYQHYFVDDHRILLTFWTEFWQKIVHLLCIWVQYISKCSNSMYLWYNTFPVSSTGPICPPHSSTIGKNVTACNLQSNWFLSVHL